MVCFRDIAEGTLFYIYCKNDAASVELFLMRDSPWTGLCVCLFEPLYEFRVAGIAAVSSEQPLLPLVEQDFGTAVSRYIPEWTTGSEMQAIYVPNADVQVQRVSLVEGCGSAMCDGQHSPTERCCALACGAPAKLILRGIISSTHAAIHGVKFQSATWSQFFVDRESMKVRNKCDICVST